MGEKALAIFALFAIIISNQVKTAFAQEQAGSSAVPVAQKTSIVPDRRVNILRAYLASKNSPLANSADLFVQRADKYNIDWRLLASISGVESTFGQQIPNNSFNAWGWGIYGDNRIYFSSWDNGIQTISEGIREQYMDQWGAQNVYQLGKLYAASPTWAQRVDYFMNDIDKFAANDPSGLSISL